MVPYALFSSASPWNFLYTLYYKRPQLFCTDFILIKYLNQELFLLVFLLLKCYNRFKEILSTGTAGTVLPLSIIK